MTNSSSDIAVGGATATTHIAGRVAEIAVGLMIVASLTGAWLAYFTFVPFDLRLH